MFILLLNYYLFMFMFALNWHEDLCLEFKYGSDAITVYNSKSKTFCLNNSNNYDLYIWTLIYIYMYVYT
jgi:hypothetical protein